MDLLAKKKAILKLLNKAEDQSLDKGIDITSDKFQEIMEIAKKKLLETNNLTSEEFNAIGKDNKEEEIKQEREDHSKEIEELNKTNQEIKDISKEQQEKQEDFNKEITLKNKEHEEDIDLLADATNELWKKD